MSQNAAHNTSQPNISLVDRLRNPNFAQSPTFAESYMRAAADRIEELESLGRFLVDRLEEFDPGDDEPEREFHGHVAPALSRFSAALPKQEPGT